MTDTKPVVAVIGADTLKGETLVGLLSERGFPAASVFPLALGDKVGDAVPFGNRELVLKAAEGFDFAQTPLVFAATADASVQRAREAGATVIELGTSLAAALQRVLLPLHEAMPISRLSIVSMEAASTAGGAAVAELGRQSADLLNFREVKAEVLPRQIAFNLIPQIGELFDDGRTSSERNAIAQIQAMLGDDKLRVQFTSVLAPVFYGHSVAVHLETARPLLVAKAATVLQGADGVVLTEGDQYPTAVGEASGQDEVFVGRLRQDPNGLSFWLVADNLRPAGNAAIDAAEDWLREQN